MPNAPIRVTLRDIARLAGCHHSTVSLALRNHREIPAQTRQRIQKLAESAGYRPDPMLASLAAYRHARAAPRNNLALAWVTNFPTRLGWREEEIYAEYFEGARERAHQLGFAFREFWLREAAMSPARASQILSARGVEGLVIAPQPVPHAQINLDWERFCAVTIGYSVTSPRLHMIGPNQYRCMLLACEQLRRRAYRRIGCVMLKASDERVDHNWHAGYLVAQQDLPARERVPALLLPRWDEAAFARWLRTARPDAIISKCAEALPALRRLGYKAPVDIGVAYLTRVKPGREVSGVNESPLEVGSAAIDYLAGLLRHGDRGVPGQPRRLLVEGNWVEGRTVRHLPPEAALAV